MNNHAKILISIVVAIVIIGSGVTLYHFESPGSTKGVMITVESGYNQSVPLKSIVSLDPSATAALYAIGAYSTLVGGNIYDSYPPNSSLPNITDYPSMDLEAIYNLSPQAVISFANYSGSQISDLLNAGIDYIFLSSDSGSNFSTIEKQNTLLGKITGYSQNASKLNNWMNQSLSVLNSTAASASSSGEMSGMYYLSSYGGIYTAGNNTFINQYFKYAHIKNIASPYYSGFYTIASGNIINASPEVMFLNPYVNYTSLKLPPFNGTPAVQNNMTFTIPSDSLFDEANFRDIYAIQWMIYVTYNVTVQLPAFPIHLEYNPDPLTIG